MRVLRAKAVTDKLDIHRNTLYLWVRDGKFPKPFDLNGTGVWDEAEVDEWLQQQKEKRDGYTSQTEDQSERSVV